MSLTSKFLLGVVIGVVLVHAAAAMVQVRREAALFEADMSRDARVLGRALASAAESTWATAGSDAVADLLRHVTERETHLRVRWVRLDATPGSALAPAVAIAQLDEEQVVSVDRGKRAGVYSYTPVAVRDRQERHAIEVMDPLADEHGYLRESVLGVLIAAASLVGLCSLWIWGFGIAVIGRPMKKLVDHARRVGRGELDHETDLVQDDEIGILGQELNRMVAGLRRAREQTAEEAEARLRAIDQLRHADRLKTIGALASGIAHELGTPINVVRGHVQLLDEETDDVALRDRLGIIARQTERMANIIQQLLDFARRGRRSDGSANVHVAAALTLEMLEPLARKHDVTLKLRSKDENMAVAMELGALQQVLTNVMMNGVQSMYARGGTLTVEVDADAEVATVRVRDQGIGMIEAVALRVFEPFFTTKDVGEGTGLGLSVAHGIVEDAGGSIEVESEPGRGTLFTLRIPRVVA